MLSCNNALNGLTRRGLILSALAMSACGFTPLHNTQTSANALAHHIAFAEPKDRNGFDFVAQMQDRFGPTEVEDFMLRYDITTASDALAITSAQEINRYNVTGSVQFQLEDNAGNTLHQGTVRSFTSYSAAGSTVSTLTGERDARKRLMIILADKVTTRLLAHNVAPR